MLLYVSLVSDMPLTFVHGGGCGDHLGNFVDAGIDALIEGLKGVGDGESHVRRAVLVHLLHVIVQLMVKLEMAPHVWLVETLKDDENDDHVEQEEKDDAAGQFQDDLGSQAHVIPICGAHLPALPTLLCLFQPIFLLLGDRDRAECRR